jgi:hypothetical protein
MAKVRRKAKRAVLIFRAFPVLPEREDRNAQAETQAAQEKLNSDRLAVIDLTYVMGGHLEPDTSFDKRARTFARNCALSICICRTRT